MNTRKTSESRGGWDDAVGARLRKLGAMPVETERVAAALEREIGRPAAAAAARGRRLWLGMRPLRAMAASLLLMAGIVTLIVVGTANGPALAVPAQMAQMHEDLASGRTPAVRVSSIEEANKALADQSRNCPELPDMPAGHAMACCMKSVKNKKVACLLMKREGVPVTLMVAYGRDVRSPESPVHTRNGARYYVTSTGKLNMVMTERQERWICLIGEVPPERLLDIADGLKF
jgi:hypothetical protein